MQHRRYVFIYYMCRDIQYSKKPPLIYNTAKNLRTPCCILETKTKDILCMKNGVLIKIWAANTMIHPCSTENVSHYTHTVAFPLKMLKSIYGLRHTGNILYNLLMIYKPSVVYIKTNILSKTRTVLNPIKYHKSTQAGA